MFLSFSTSFMIRSHLTLFLLTQQNSCHGHERYIVVHFLPVNIYLSVKFRRRWKGSETFLTVSTANFHIAICRSPCPHKSNRNCSVSSARRPADGVFWFRDDEPKRNIYIYRHDTTTIIFTDSSPNFYLWYGASRPRRNEKKEEDRWRHSPCAERCFERNHERKRWTILTVPDKESTKKRRKKKNPNK